MIVYKATNKENGKVYIGVTSGTLKNRAMQHKYEANSNTKNKFKLAIRHFGFDAFEWEVIDSSNDPKEIVEKESYWIRKYKSNEDEYGYNSVEMDAVNKFINCAKTQRSRKNIPLNNDLYKEIKILAAINGKNANDLIEEGMERIIEEYKKKLEKGEKNNGSPVNAAKQHQQAI